jgi:MFS transporter, DHA1 family, multidrug resistance protein
MQTGAVRSPRCHRTLGADEAVCHDAGVSSSGQTAVRRLPSGSGLVLVLGAMTALGPLSIDVYLPALPEIETDLATSTSMVQLTLTACLVGLAVGQLVMGSLSDAVGRRRPLLLGMSAYVGATFACALAPTIEWLIAARFVQGFCGATGVVIARSVVRDLFTGAEAVRFLGSLMLVTGLAPILGPVLGALVMGATSWRGIFVLIGTAGAVFTAIAHRRLVETLPVERRRRGGLRASVSTFGELLADRRFVGYVLASGLIFATAFVYIASAPFVLKELFGLTSVSFAVVFGLNSMALMGFGQVSRFVVHRLGSRRLFLAGLAMSGAGGSVVLAVISLDLPLGFLLAGFFLVVGAIGLVSPNATALALADHGDKAGSASALQGVAQFVLGATAAPFAGIAGNDTALPAAILMFALPLLAIVAAATLVGRSHGPRRVARSSALSAQVSS